MNTKLTRRTAIAGGLSVAMTCFLSDLADAHECTTEEKCWKYVRLDPKKVAQSVYDTFGTNGCMYGAVKGALIVFADTTQCAADKVAAQNFPFLSLRYGRSGVAKLKEICGAVNGGIMLMSFFVENYADIPKMAKKLADFSAETELPTFIPTIDEHPNFLKVASHGITCREMGSAWMGVATPEQKKIVGERCKRHAASIMAKAVEILNEYYGV